VVYSLLLLFLDNQKQHGSVVNKTRVVNMVNGYKTVHTIMALTMLAKKKKKRDAMLKIKTERDARILKTKGKMKKRGKTDEMPKYDRLMTMYTKLLRAVVDVKMTTQYEEDGILDTESVYDSAMGIGDFVDETTLLPDGWAYCERCRCPYDVATVGRDFRCSHAT